MMSRATASTDVEAAAALIGQRARRDVPLAPLTTYRVGGRAALFVEVATIDDLHRVAAARAATGLAVLTIGRGSNMLVADSGYPGIVVSLAEFAGQIAIGTADDDGRVVVAAGGGVALPVLARRTAAASVAGFEWAVGVPGSIGGAVRMNAGGHGSDMAASVIDVDLFDLGDPAAVKLRRVDARDLGLRFRGSDLTDDQLVVEVRLDLRRGDREAAEREIAEIVRWRREHQPGGQNCGSVFVNPVPGEVTAGGLIDGLGLRGLRIGTAWVSEKHANFIQSTDGGAAADVRAVMEAVRDRVAAATGYVLRSEVRLIGFDDEPGAGTSSDE
ncbi:MAG TPA: UDP-N-acetylmuramate dehydrogenase [Ilumatobacteraceae bacterium]|nr:UDP-N-acetylmuramate dehydrogenase [Ilumatobacteraceae bacterium]